MKINKILYSAMAALILAGGTTACTGEFEEINTNPNTMLVGELNPYGVFEAMFYGFGKKHEQFGYAYSNQLVQVTACGSTSNYIHRYSFTSSQLESIWSGYAQYGANAVHMMQQAEKKDEPAAKAVAMTLKVLFMSNITAIFGDIPYKEAFRSGEGITTPVFDSQEDIYRMMFEELEEANAMYAEKPVWSKPAIDHMYGGDMSKWRKFNNSLYLRLLLRVSGRPELDASTKIAEILSDPKTYPIITSQKESATIVNSGVDPYYSYFRPSNITSTSFGSYYLTTTMVDLCVRPGLVSEVDPRLTTWAVRSGGDWVGVRGGGTVSEFKEDVDGVSSMNYKVLVRDAAPVWLFDYSEILFIKAEAALKGFIEGGETAAREYYEEAVAESCRKWSELSQYSDTKVEITDARIERLLSGQLACWTNFEDKMALIATQKFLSLIWNGFECYHELRRTGYPIITIGNGCSYNNYEYPQRLPYPVNTVGSNPVNVQAALNRMGGENTMRTPLWWSYMAINGKFTAVRASQN